ncbi:MAG: hypothetical protein K5893_09935 [Prevotella sp.]|nr:hypothetical protein [Prevotella sp.]
MKKYLLLLLAMTTSMYALAVEYHSLEEIRDQWASRNIKVPQGGKTPGIIQLLKAFQDTWHSYTIGPVLEKAKNPNFTFEADEEYGGGITVDRKNGYVSLDNGGTDSDYMEACLWRRDNGHRLFIIRLGQPVDPEIEFLCYYDYDPKTFTMYPETGPEQEFHPLNKDNQLGYKLPQKGKDIIISEYDINLGSNINHVFSWDGNKHHFSHISIDDLEYGYRWFNPKETDYLVNMTKIAFITLPGHEDYFYLLSDDEEEGMLALAPYKGDLELIGINNPISLHQLSFYPNVVVTKAEINEYTSYAFLKDGYVLQMIDEYRDSSGQSKTTVDGWDDISEEASREMIRSIGQPIQIKPEWRKVRLND